MIDILEMTTPNAAGRRSLMTDSLISRRIGIKTGLSDAFQPRGKPGEKLIHSDFRHFRPAKRTFGLRVTPLPCIAVVGAITRSVELGSLNFILLSMVGFPSHSADNGWVEPTPIRVCPGPAGPAFERRPRDRRMFRIGRGCHLFR